MNGFLYWPVFVPLRDRGRRPDPCCVLAILCGCRFRIFAAAAAAGRAGPMSFRPRCRRVGAVAAAVLLLRPDCVLFLRLFLRMYSCLSHNRPGNLVISSRAVNRADGGTKYLWTGPDVDWAGIGPNVVLLRMCIGPDIFYPWICIGPDVRSAIFLLRFDFALMYV